MNETRVVALLTEGDIKTVARKIAGQMASAQREGGEELDEDELATIIEAGLMRLDASRAD